MEERSSSYQLNQVDLRKTVRDLIVAGLVLFGMSNFTDGQYSIYIDALTYAAVQLAWRFVKKN